MNQKPMNPASTSAVKPKKTPYHKWTDREIHILRLLMGKYGLNWSSIAEEFQNQFRTLTQAQILRKAKSLHRASNEAAVKPKSHRWSHKETQNLYAAILAHGDNWTKVAARHKKKFPYRAADAVRRKGMQLLNPETQKTAAQKRKKPAKKTQPKKRVKKNQAGSGTAGNPQQGVRKRRQRKDYSSSPEPAEETLEERKKRLARNQRRRNQRLKAKMEAKGQPQFKYAANDVRLLRFLDSPSP